jgi:hypothetical protein
MVIGGGSVLKDETGYKMWYSGKDYRDADGGRWRILFTTSENGISDWDPGIPVLDEEDPPLTWEKHKEATSVSQVGTEYKMWYTGQDGATPGYQVGYAFSEPICMTPVIDPIIVSPDPIQVNTQIDVETTFTGNDCSETYVATWTWGDSATSLGTIVGTTDVKTVTGSHYYDTPGVYTVSLTVAHDTCGSDTKLADGYVVVYDPEGGFVTGGGWISSPVGAYSVNPTLTGKANFGFVSKYKKGATVPTGETEFVFHVADLNFHSDSYDWLVIAGQKAIYKGVGTINGDSDYKFLLSAIDGDVQGGSDVDTFRIKIWTEDDAGVETVIYDNQVDGEPDDDADPTTELGGGNIKIHKG